MHIATLLALAKMLRGCCRCYISWPMTPRRLLVFIVTKIIYFIVDTEIFRMAKCALRHKMLSHLLRRPAQAAFFHHAFFSDKASTTYLYFARRARLSPAYAYDIFFIMPRQDYGMMLLFISQEADCCHELRLIVSLVLLFISFRFDAIAILLYNDRLMRKSRHHDYLPMKTRCFYKSDIINS